jgi:hypothetical protein
MHKNATKCNETLSKWCKNKHGASKIIDTFETYQAPFSSLGECVGLGSGLWDQRQMVVFEEVERCCIYHIIDGWSQRHGAVGSLWRTWNDVHRRAGAQSGIMAASMASLACTMQIFVLNMAQWFDVSDDFWACAWGARWGSARPDVCSQLHRRVTRWCP